MDKKRGDGEDRCMRGSIAYMGKLKDIHRSGRPFDSRISFANSAHASKANSSERTSVLSQSNRRVVI